jgi:phosphoserine aminotransferase
MSTFLSRLEEEQEELSSKVFKLHDFVNNNPIYNTISIVQQRLLAIQLNAMKIYLSILDERLRDLSPQTNN